MNNVLPINLGRQRIRKVVFAALVDVLALDEATLEESLKVVEDLDADSMSILALVIVIEDALSIEIDPAELHMSDATIGHVIDYISGQQEP
jgi:acyl carrier protein